MLVLIFLNVEFLNILVIYIFVNIQELKFSRYFLSIEKDTNKRIIPAGIYLLKVKNRNTRTRCEICSKLTIKIPERRHWRRSSIFIINFEHISNLCSSVTIVNFEQVNADWVGNVWFSSGTFLC